MAQQSSNEVHTSCEIHGESKLGPLLEALSRSASAVSRQASVVSDAEQLQETLSRVGSGVDTEPAHQFPEVSLDNLEIDPGHLAPFDVQNVLVMKVKKQKKHVQPPVLAEDAKEGPTENPPDEPSAAVEAQPEAEGDEEEEEEYDTGRLLTLWDTLDFSGVNATRDYGDSHIETSRELLETVIDYAKGQPMTHAKLAFIGYELERRAGTEEALDAPQILSTLAAHGTVCGVEKEAGIRSVYGLLSNSLRSEAERVGLKGLILHRLTRHREEIVEKNSREATGSDNDHYIFAYRNLVARFTGVEPVHDDHGSFWSSALMPEFVDRFFAEYTVTAIVRVLDECLCNPEQIPFRVVQDWFQSNRPADVDAYAWLRGAFDEWTGKPQRPAVLHMLQTIGVLRARTEEGPAVAAHALVTEPAA
eukprot:TRINITY_DN1403_c0_g3_i1.p1 TRINITY_DN1403_c0_g3~~TRINITY_DN1403_c0_g3_i1.p1  ORF type:complete len:418 (-),score=83.82 TRINITY_DN1403_c0_g3_i1:634-1887(-)